MPPLNTVSTGDWVKADMIQVGNDILVKVDLPSMVPNQDFVVQTFGNRLFIKGERRQEIPEGFVALQQARPHGKFELVLDLPASTDVSNSEQTFFNGVLTIKFPLKEKDHSWRTLTVNYIKDDHYWG